MIGKADRKTNKSGVFQKNIEISEQDPCFQDKKPCAEAEFLKIVRCKFGIQVNEI